eukprot:3404846-Alexandrium_andersonii.AAC.1
MSSSVINRRPALGVAMFAHTPDSDGGAENLRTGAHVTPLGPVLIVVPCHVWVFWRHAAGPPILVRGH